MIFITPSELQVLEQVKKGKTPLEISKVLYKDYSTVSYKIRSMIAKGVLKKDTKKGVCEYTGVSFEVGKPPMESQPQPWLTDDKVWLTPKLAEVYEALIAGKTRKEIMQELHINGNSVNSYYDGLIARGMMKRLDYNKYEMIQRPYKIEKKPTFGRPVANPTQYTLDVPQDILDYVKGHYKLYERKRGELARKLGITRTLLNQIAIEHKLARGG